MSRAPAAFAPYLFAGPIETDRLLIRLMTVDDVDAVYAYQSREDVCRYLLFSPRERVDVARSVAENAAADTLERDGDHLQLAVQRRADARMIGDLFFTIKSTANLTVELGWTFHPDAQGHGYATEGARALLELAFGTLGMHRVIAELDPRNSASVALCGRLGLRAEAHLHEDLWVKDEWADTGIYAMLQSEWRERPTP